MDEYMNNLASGFSGYVFSTMVSETAALINFRMKSFM